ncbi:MAG TPA: hypothetical protein VFD27_05180, partial [Chthoniobacteraceae bacterium]|nr:hypothetical protein [Chthoniobacteraceae bacterium]
FIPLLADAALWKKWADRDRQKNAARPIKWAPLPTPPKITDVVPTSEKNAVTWRFTFEKPADDWMTPAFNEASWKSGPGGFGTAETPGSVVRTDWKTSDIWARREFALPAGDTSKLDLMMYHDEDAEIYINGVLAAKVHGFNGTYDTIPLSVPAHAALKPGNNVLAVHCHQTRGGQFIDVGLVRVEE